MQAESQGGERECKGWCPSLVKNSNYSPLVTLHSRYFESSESNLYVEFD